ncbi:hypothetical protein CBL_01529 [Carabus blaptoides fortunei]
MVPLKLTVLLFTLASLCLCDDAQSETHRILNEGPVYTPNKQEVPNQRQDFESSNANVYGYNNNNKYEDLLKQYYTGKHANGNGNEYNIAQNTQVNYGQYGNGQISIDGRQYGQLYGKNYGNYLNYNSGLVNGYVDTKPVSSQIPTENYYGYNSGEIQNSDTLSGFKNIAAKSLPLEIPTGSQYEYNYGQAHQTNGALKGSVNAENIKTLPIQVPGQDFHEYSYEEALKASNANTKSVATQVPTDNQYGYSYEELLKANGVLTGSGNIKSFPNQAQTENYYGYNHGQDVKATADLNGYLYNIGNVAFNKQVRNEVPQQNYYTAREGKQINVDNGISNAFLPGYGYDNANTDLGSKPVATDAYQANAKEYIDLYQIAQNGVASEFVPHSATANYKTKSATALVYHTNIENQKYPTPGINNGFEAGYEKFNNYPVPTSVPVSVSNPQYHEVKSIQSFNPNLNELTQSVVQYDSHKYPLTSAESTAIQTPQNYNIDNSKPYPVNAHYTPSGTQSTSELNAYAYTDSVLQSSPIDKQQIDIPSAYVKEHKPIHGLEQQIKDYQVPKIISFGPYHSSAHPVKMTINNHNVAGYSNPGSIFETKKLLEQYGANNNRAPVTFNNNAYESDEYFYDGNDSQVHQNENVHTEYAQDSSQHDHNVVNSNAQYGAYDTINYNSYQNTAKGNQFNGHNATDDNSNLFNYNGYESYDNQHGSEVSEQLTAGFGKDNYRTNVYNQQPNSYTSNNYVSIGYGIGDNNYHSNGHAANNIQTGEYVPNTYKTITNVSNEYDLGYHSNSAGYESGYITDTYNANGLKPIELTTSTYGNGNQDTFGYNLNAQESQDFAAYNQLTQDHKTSSQVKSDYNSNQFKPLIYSTSEDEADNPLKENGTGQSDIAHSKLNDQNNEEHKSKSTGKSHKSKKEKSASSSAFVSVKHGDHSYSYSVKQNSK